MRQVLLLILTGLLTVAPVATATAVSTENDAAAAGADYRTGDGTSAGAFIAGAADADGRIQLLPGFVLLTDASAGYDPAWLQMFGFITAPVDDAVGVVESNEATAPTAKELRKLQRQGARASASAAASSEEVSYEAGAESGSTSIHEEDAMAVPAGQGSSPSFSYIVQDESAAAPAADEPTVEDDTPGFAAASGPMALSGADAIMADVDVPVVVAATLVAASTTGAAFLVTPGWRFALWKALRRLGALVLFSRIAQEDILNHNRRNELFEYIKQNPGERVEIARKALGISNGSMHYHLKVLRDRNLIRILRENGLARLYPAGPKINPQPYVPAQRRRFLDLLSARPGVSQREASQILGISERMTSYHVHALTGQGLVDVQTEGAKRRLFLRCTSVPTPMIVAAA